MTTPETDGGERPPALNLGPLAAERGDYRLRRDGLLWAVERRWRDGWTRIGRPMRYLTAHAVFHELDDWQRCAGTEACEVMRGR